MDGDARRGRTPGGGGRGSRGAEGQPPGPRRAHAALHRAPAAPPALPQPELRRRLPPAPRGDRRPLAPSGLRHPDELPRPARRCRLRPGPCACGPRVPPRPPAQATFAGRLALLRRELLERGRARVRRGAHVLPDRHVPAGGGGRVRAHRRREPDCRAAVRDQRGRRSPLAGRAGRPLRDERPRRVGRRPVRLPAGPQHHTLPRERRAPAAHHRRPRSGPRRGRAPRPRGGDHLRVRQAGPSAGRRRVHAGRRRDGHAVLLDPRPAGRPGRQLDRARRRADRARARSLLVRPPVGRVHRCPALRRAARGQQRGGSRAGRLGLVHGPVRRRPAAHGVQPARERPERLLSSDRPGRSRDDDGHRRRHLHGPGRRNAASCAGRWT